MSETINNIANQTFDALDVSQLLNVGSGISISGSTYTVSPKGTGLAVFDNWNGTTDADGNLVVPEINNPDVGDAVSYSVFIPTPSTPNVVEYTFTTGNGDVNPAAGGLGAEVVASNSTGVLLEELPDYIPGPSPDLSPTGGNVTQPTYFVLSTVPLNEYDANSGNFIGEQATPAELTFTAICFLAGTVIATASGDVAVESLSVGDLVLTASGAARPIVWIGTGKVLNHRGRRSAATPVIIRKGALGPNVPNRDLHVTKGHSFYLDGVLIPVEFLVNHRSIVWDDHAPAEVTLYHIELETHDLLLANGAPAESYRDDGNRWLFQNANVSWDQRPKRPFAPVLTGGPVVDAVWRRLLDQSGPRPGLLLTDQPELHVVVDGVRVDAEQSLNGAWIFRLPVMDETTRVRIVSRSAAPDELGVARDSRLLGVALRRVVVRKGIRSRAVEAADERLVEGFHAYEAEDKLRWTNGDAALPANLFGDFGRDVELVLHVGGTSLYLADDVGCQAAA